MFGPDRGLHKINVTPFFVFMVFHVTTLFVVAKNNTLY